MKSWKTTLAGLLAILSAAVGAFWPQHLPLVGTLTGVLAGLGLIAARDNNVTSGQVFAHSLYRKVRDRSRLPAVLIPLGLAVLMLPACESLPVAVAYRTQVSGHDVSAAYSSKDGLAVAAEHLRVLTQK